MIRAIHGSWRTGILGALSIGLALTSALAQEPLTDLKPLVGKWKGFITTPRGSVPADVTIQDGGAYTIVVYIRPSATVPGALQLVDGKAHFKHADGSTGTLTLNVDGKGKRVMKWVRDDGQGTAEYEPVK
jgi:hypothetical protein